MQYNTNYYIIQGQFILVCKTWLKMPRFHMGVLSTCYVFRGGGEWGLTMFKGWYLTLQSC